MAGISIPGVTDKYKTNDTVEKLMQIERIPLTREQKTLENYKSEQETWRSLSRKVTSLRDNVKTLYSFENPFNNKLAESTQEYAITAEATRKASYDSFKIDVVQTATADRFLTSELPEDTKVPAGIYTYKISDKTISMRWKGGSLQDFSTALNKRGNNLLKSRVIGASKGKKTLAIESLKTGEENKLSFEDDAKSFAESTGMIVKIKPKSITFANSRSELLAPPPIELEQNRLPQVSANSLSVIQDKITVPARGGFQTKIPDSIKTIPNAHIQFSIEKKEIQDITQEINKQSQKPELPDSGTATFKDVTIINSPVDAMLPLQPTEKPEPVTPITTSDIVFAVMADGSEKIIQTPDILIEKKLIDIKLSDYPNIQAIAVRNRNTGYSFTVSSISGFNPNQNLGFTPQHPISTAQDAIIKYEGITIKRPDNDIDDIIPEVTLHVHEKTDKTATLSIKPDVEAAKEALITFVGKYNQAMAELNILSQNKPELIEELDYLSNDEKEELKEKLGMFTADSSISSLKSNMQLIASAKYAPSESAQVTMLNQIGIATNATSYSGYTPSKLRGYLEIDEKKLDSELEKNLDDIKNLFGFDSDGDLIIDSGLGYRMDKQLTAYVQSGGIFAMKTSSLDGKIKSSEQKISKLEDQMQSKEAELRNKYGQMEGTLNNLESQQNSIQNFSNSFRRGQ